MGLTINKQPYFKWYLNTRTWSKRLLERLHHIKKRDHLVRHELQDILTPAFQKKEPPLFYHVQFETVSICNNDCSFCPMNRRLRKREYKEADWEVISRLGSELQSCSFDGVLSLFNNNEPLIDKRLPEIVAFFRTKIPKASIRILTNGILINMKIVEQLIQAGMNQIGINNYNDKNKFIPSIRKFVDDFRSSKYKDAIDIDISMRYKNEVMHNRGGNSPNNRPLNSSKRWFCLFPFEQINVNPWGDLTICCNDVMYKHKIGTILGNETIYQLWSNKEYSNIRNSLVEGKREKIDICSVCDNPGIGGTGGNFTYKIEKSTSDMYRIYRVYR
ncbi:MAG: radical SAM/SPASM domain-containing protein [Nitrospirae bacterium]|nr:radical SAM/SPASM domain-containing protein [Nitrospirota bacterium]